MTKGKKDNYIFWHSPLALILLFLVLIFFGYRIIDLIQKERETSQKKELILDQIDSLKQRQNSLSKDISKINTEEGKEEIIREKYQVAKDGEKMVIIVDEVVKDDSVEGRGNEGHGFWNWIKRIFKN
ncbi:MAG: septum formation initiator family protein [Candidatus Paceibacterota bacterium]|jgi:cell division protein FtsB